MRCKGLPFSWRSWKVVSAQAVVKTSIVSDSFLECSLAFLLNLIHNSLLFTRCFPEEQFCICEDLASLSRTDLLFTEVLGSGLLWARSSAPPVVSSMGWAFRSRGYLCALTKVLWKLQVLKVQNIFGHLSKIQFGIWVMSACGWRNMFFML